MLRVTFPLVTFLAFLYASRIASSEVLQTATTDLSTTFSFPLVFTLVITLSPYYVQGDKSLRPPSKDVDTKCEHLTFRNPYLQLGPFLLEHSNKEGNYVAVMHSLLSENEMENIKAKARGQMKATPYSIANTQHQFSYKRTSKVKYIR